MNEHSQPGILAPVPPVGRVLSFRIAPEAYVKTALAALRDGYDLECGVAGIGMPAVLAVEANVPGLRCFPAMSGPGCTVPSTQQSLVFLLRGDDRGVVFDATQQIRRLLADAFILEDVVDTFVYHGGRDLTRFEDGTENPKDDKAVRAAIVAEGKGMRGSSFVAVQQWVHDLARFRSYGPERGELLIGRSAKTNEELDDAPESAHVKRAAQESYDPEAFMVRRSMPWATAEKEGLEFVAYVENLDRYERVLHRMTGLDDGIIDGLFLFSRPVTGGYYWCPPVRKGKLDLRQLGI